MDGLTAACFAKDPSFARRAFAFRLLSLFVPPKLSKKLMVILKMRFFDPTGMLPPGVDLPPWSIVYPGAVWPPDWKLGDPWPDGFYPPTDVSLYDIVNNPVLKYFYDFFWSTAFYHPGKITPAPSGSWITHTDDSDWEDDATYVRRAYWDDPGQYWYGDITAFRLRDLGTWVTSFRPTKIRFTLAAVPTCHFYLTGGGGFSTIAEEASYSSGDEITLDFSDGVDIEKLLIIGTGSKVSNIQFWNP